MASIRVEDDLPQLGQLLARFAKRRRLGLGAADAAQLLDAARGRGPMATELSQHQAIGLLRSMLAPDESVDVLSTLATDAAAPVAARVAATRALGPIGDDRVRDTLLAQSADVDVRVRGAAYTALAEAATAADLQSLAAIDEPVAAAQRVLAFARTVVAHREGLDEHVIEPASASPIRPVPGAHTRAVALTDLTTPDADAAVRGLRGSRYGIDLAADVQRLTCGSTGWELFANAELGGFAVPFERLVERPWVFGLAALRRPAVDIADTQYVLLTRPTPPTVALEVVRTDGVIAYVGTIEPSDRGWRFTLADTDRPQTAPTDLAGVVDDTGVHLTASLVAATRVRLVGTVPAPPDEP